MSVQEPQEQFEREQTESTEESQDFPVETPLTDSDPLPSSTEPGSVEVPTEEVAPASSEDPDLMDEPEPADDIRADGTCHHLWMRRPIRRWLRALPGS